jgi:prenyltransferase beta subunit
MFSDKTQKILDDVIDSTIKYLIETQDLSAGIYYGSFWSEKAFHHPFCDYNAGGSHHHRTAGSAALALWQIGVKRNNNELKHRAELAFDWLVYRQLKKGGFYEVQNNEKPADWESTGQEECSTVSTAFVVKGLCNALLQGLPPKPLYFNLLMKACLWQISIERPAGSGVFPHHDFSPFDTLNANLHAADTLMSAYIVLKKIYFKNLHIFFQASKRAINHTILLQSPDGSFHYRDYGGITINYTSVVLWCMLNVRDYLSREDLIEGYFLGGFKSLISDKEIEAFNKGATFLRKCVSNNGQMIWDQNETSWARGAIWTYFITINVMLRIGGQDNILKAEKLLEYVLSKRTNSGLLALVEDKEEITMCAYMQADILCFILGFYKDWK